MLVTVLLPVQTLFYDDDIYCRSLVTKVQASYVARVSCCISALLFSETVLLWSCVFY